MKYRLVKFRQPTRGTTERGTPLITDYMSMLCPESTKQCVIQHEKWKQYSKKYLSVGGVALICTVDLLLTRYIIHVVTEEPKHWYCNTLGQTA